MPAVLKIDRQRRIVVSTFYGEVTGENLLQHRATIRADVEFNPDFADIVDFTGVNLVSVPETALAQLASSESLFHKHVPHVIVTPAELPTGLALQYRDIARDSRPNFYVVRTLDEAHALLRNLGYGR